MFNARVLVVDDNEVMRTFLVRALGGFGITAAAASDGDDALKQLGKQKFAVAVVDVLLPNRPGLQTIRIMKREHPDLRIVAISGAEATMGIDYLPQAREAGADMVLKKPFKTAQLVEALGKLE